MSLYMARYTLEHKLIPQFFFNKEEAFVVVLLKNKDFLFSTFEKICESEGIENPYTEDQFSAEILKVRRETVILKITFPEPEQEPLCYHCYLIFEKDFSKERVFMVEKGNTFGDGLPFVCMWDRDGNHYNLGNCSIENGKDLKLCLRSYSK